LTSLAEEEHPNERFLTNATLPEFINQIAHLIERSFSKCGMPLRRERSQLRDRHPDDIGTWDESVHAGTHLWVSIGREIVANIVDDL
jgi:hypothetical protein